MTATLQPDQLVRLTVEQYHALVPAGILSEGAPIELLDGLLLWKNRADSGESMMTVGKRHARAVTRLQMLLTRMCDDHGCFAQIQQPITLSAIDETEPDAAIVIGSIDDERERHPEPLEVLVVIEVADSSLDQDRHEKLSAYAAAGIREYWIVNLVNNQIEVHQSPDTTLGRYSVKFDRGLHDEVNLVLPDGSTLTVAVSVIIR